MSRLVTRLIKSTVTTAGGSRAVAATSARVPHVRKMSTVADSIEPPKELKTTKFFDFEHVEKNVFRATNLTTSGQQSKKAAYGGLIMAQAMAAAESTVPPSFKPHSMHAYFILSVDTTVPVDYHVRLLRDGRSFCTRSVEAIQKGKVVFSQQSSFHVVEPDSCVHQSSYPTVVKPASECPEFNDAANEILTKINSGEITGSEHTRAALAKYSQSDRTKWLFDMRCTDTASLFGLGDPSRTFHFWIRSKVPISSTDERLHRWLIIFASDACPATVIFRPHTKNDFAPSMVFSLDHVMYFHHHEIKSDEWLLYEVESTSAGVGRGFSRGRIWGTDGKLLVSLTQEALVRTRGEVSRL